MEMTPSRRRNTVVMRTAVLPSVTSLATRNLRKPTVRVLLSAAYAAFCITHTKSKRANHLKNPG
jgi:hypothetical protein